ncbi:MAG TPA: AAA family ATPase, partial [Polyangiales bacterium]|nr:AAA family ATPase [Polyangiales bacterium]
LVLSLLDQNPLARPASAAEVIAKLTVIGELAPDDDDELTRLATSFLSTPSFVGRREELDALRARVEAMIKGHGSAVQVEAGAGMGRTRLLEEVGVLAQLAGAHPLRVDASMHRQPRGTLRALCLRALDGVPGSVELAARLGPAARAELDALDGQRPLRRSSVVRNAAVAASGVERSVRAELTLEGWLALVCEGAPLLLQVDNAEYADDASLGSLASLARDVRDRRMMIVVTHQPPAPGRRSVGLSALQAHCTRMTLTALSAHETLQLARSLFGEATNLARFADFLFTRTAGNPLHCLEISRQLVAQRVIRYLGGNWALPTERPDAAVPGALESAICARLDALSPAARRLAECLSLHRGEAKPALCSLLAGADSERSLLRLLDELARNDVLHSQADGIRFSGAALRETLLAEMDEAAREVAHARLGEALLQLARSRADRNHSQLIEAGYHLLQGGDQTRGAELIAQVASDSVAVRLALADLSSAGSALEAALKVYRRQRRSPYERLPLLAALAQAGYYEDRRWGELYGDEALDTLEDVCGLRVAKRVGRVLGRTLGLCVGIAHAFLRFSFAPRRERSYGFREVLIQLFGAVTCLTAVAVLCLDAVRARKVADTLEPFASLPDRLTPVGIYQFCQSLRQIALEDQPRAFATFTTLIQRFRDPRYYPSLPEEARTIYVAGAHFARGVFASYHGSGETALQDADALDALQLKFYAMIASELRFLYYMNHGDYARAASHREQVDIHAAHVGSAWQVELWEPAALIPVYSWLQDVDGMARVADRLEELSQSIPSLRHYARLARWAQGLVLTDAMRGANAAAMRTLEQVEPRSYIGWAA